MIYLIHLAPRDNIGTVLLFLDEAFFVICFILPNLFGPLLSLFCPVHTAERCLYFVVPIIINSVRMSSPTYVCACIYISVQVCRCVCGCACISVWAPASGVLVYVFCGWCMRCVVNKDNIFEFFGICVHSQDSNFIEVTDTVTKL